MFLLFFFTAQLFFLFNNLVKRKKNFKINFTNFVLIGKLWTRSMKVAYNILHKLGTKQEPMVRPGDRVSISMIFNY